MLGADLSFCLHKSPVSGVSRWVDRRPQHDTQHSLSRQGEPKASGAGKTSWRKAQGAEQETPGFFPLFFLPSPFLPSFLPVFGDYLEYLSQLKLWLQ